MADVVGQVHLEAQRRVLVRLLEGGLRRSRAGCGMPLN